MIVFFVLNHSAALLSFFLSFTFPHSSYTFITNDIFPSPSLAHLLSNHHHLSEASIAIIAIRPSSLQILTLSSLVFTTQVIHHRWLLTHQLPAFLPGRWLSAGRQFVWSVCVCARASRRPSDSNKWITVNQIWLYLYLSDSSRRAPRW